MNVQCRSGIKYAIQPLSGTSSFSNDTMQFMSFFVYIGDRICLHYFGGIKI